MRQRVFYLNNIMLFGNLAANLVGSGIVGVLIVSSLSASSPQSVDLMWRFGWFFDPLVFAAIAVLTWCYERPVRTCIQGLLNDEDVGQTLLANARRRLLNEPYIHALIDFSIWCVAALAYTAVSRFSDATGVDLLRILIISAQTGLIVSVAAFFIGQRVLQRHMVPLLFPEGRLWEVPGTLRTRIGMRLSALFLAVGLIPMVSIVINLQSRISAVSMGDSRSWQPLKTIVFIDICFFIVTGALLTLIVSGNFRRPLQDIIHVLQRIHRGKLDHTVRVTTNDEIGFAGDVINEMTAGLRQRDFIREAFGKYVSREIRDEILSGRIPLNGIRTEATLLFSDLRQFTTYVEKTPPEEVIVSMRDYFSAMQRVIRRNNGIVLQFVGDEIEAAFGVPMVDDRQARRALQAALDMRFALAELNRRRCSLDKPPFRHGIGIHTGWVLAGNVGGRDRLSYALIGDTVNVASRIQDLTKAFNCDILVGKATVERIEADHLQDFVLEKLPAQMVKGHVQPVDMYRLKGGARRRKTS